MASDQVNSSLPGSLNMHLNDTEHELGDTTVVEIKKASHVVYCSDGAVELFDDDTDVKEVKLVSESVCVWFLYVFDNLLIRSQLFRTWQ